MIRQTTSGSKPSACGAVRLNLSHRNHTGQGLRWAEAIAAQQIAANRAAEQAQAAECANTLAPAPRNTRSGAEK